MRGIFFSISSLQPVQRVKQSQSCTVVQTWWHCHLKSQEKIHLSCQLNHKRGFYGLRSLGKFPLFFLRLFSLRLALKVAQVIWSSVTAQVTEMLEKVHQEKTALNILVKRRHCQIGLNTHTHARHNYMPSTRNSHGQVKSKRREKVISPANTDQKTTSVAILISDKVDFRTRNIARIKKDIT